MFVDCYHLRNKASDAAQARQAQGMAVHGHSASDNPKMHASQQRIQQRAFAGA